jgi:DNA-binding MarR family transcriptional regulator
MVTRSLKDEIQQSKPFDSLELEAVLNIHRTADQLQRIVQKLLKAHELTASQYNVLRILRGAGPGGLRCSEIGDRMVSRDPDITRLLDRLDRRKLIERHRCESDRRMVFASITELGLEQLKELDPLVKKQGKVMLQHMSPQKLETLIHLLEELRGGGELV